MKYVSLLISWSVLLALLSITPAVAGGMDVVMIRTGAGEPSWSVKLASDDASRSKGLMFRKHMPANTGMLFRFDKSRPVSMWMKNTFIPLDMVFADQSGMVTYIHRGAVPHSLEIIRSRGPALFVLEINAGEADEFGLAEGNRLQHPWILPVE
jgi:uncharacterized membrane protein (UPF0127 family)